MKQVYTSMLWIAATGLVAAQTPALPPPAPLPTNFKNGSYLDVDADNWQNAKLRYTATPELLVQDADHKADAPMVLLPRQVHSFAIGRDTFDVVHNLSIPQPAQQLPLAFVRRLFRGGGYLVAEYAAYPPSPAPALAYRLLLDRPGGRIIAVLPPAPQQFRLALAAAVRDYQPLATQLELDPKVLPAQLPELLAAYGRWKQTQLASAKDK